MRVPLTVNLTAILAIVVFQNCTPGFSSLKSSGAEASLSSVSNASSPMQLAYSTMQADLQNHYWDPSKRRIRPTGGALGYVNETQNRTDVWQMAQYGNILYWDWKLTGSGTSKQILEDQWAYMQKAFTADQLTSGQIPIVNWSDDGAWEMNYLVQVHESTGDPKALQYAQTLIKNLRANFADPYKSGAGFLYAIGTGSGHDQRSSSYEAMNAASAVYLYQQTHDTYFLDYAETTYKWMFRYMKHPTRSYYYCELDLAKYNGDGSPNTHYLSPIGDYYGVPVRGNSSSYSGGTLAMAVLASRLYALTHDASYLSEMKSINQSLVTYFTRSTDLFLNERDPWTDGYWFPYYVNEVANLDGVDTNGDFARIARTTALYISRNARTSDGYYGADWSGPEYQNYPLTGGSFSYVEQSGGWTGTDQATPGQIMTSSQAAAIIVGGILSETYLQSRGRLQDLSSSTIHVCLFTGLNYQGSSVCYDGAKFMAYDLPDGFNDRIQSISIQGLTSVQVCENLSFMGECRAVTTSTPDLSASLDSSWNSRISSVRGFMPVAGSVCLYSDINGSGSSLCARPGDTYMEMPNGFNDVASSTVVTGSLSYVFCSDGEFKGNCTTNTGSISGLGAYNDAISSLKVGAP